ncbi:MAG TPA: pyrroloquinoline quinone biosynthesis protein PqqB [Candidatus Angelobacter sp.]|nr:pyrroloquinoline quinone biosynthesis protein PqqB [Candidatus Angelobacter sp.]
MRVRILGSAAGGGFPQWNCSCPNCAAVRQGTGKLRPRTQAQVAVSPKPSSWFLLNASPDLRQQLLATPELAPSPAAATSPVSTIFLTSADVDCIMGLLHLREFQPLHIYCTSAVRRILTEENNIFRVLARSNPPVRWENLALDRLIPLLPPSAPGMKDGFFCKPVSLAGHFPDFVSDSLRHSLSPEEAVVGLEFIQKEKRMFYAPSLPGAGDDWRRAVDESDLALLDGTFWKDDELIAARRSRKTAREIGHVPLSGTHGLLNQPFRLGKTRRVLIHLNNTNPVLNEESPEHRAVREAGFEIAYDGMEFEL